MPFGLPSFFVFRKGFPGVAKELPTARCVSRETFWKGDWIRQISRNPVAILEPKPRTGRERGAL